MECEISYGRYFVVSHSIRFHILIKSRCKSLSFPFRERIEAETPVFLYIQFPLQYLAECLNVSALFADVFSYKVDFIEKVGCGTLNHIGFTLFFIGIWVYDNLDSLLF